MTLAEEETKRLESIEGRLTEIEAALAAPLPVELQAPVDELRARFQEFQDRARASASETRKQQQLAREAL
jgi:hypothetical protein